MTQLYHTIKEIKQTNDTSPLTLATSNAAVIPLDIKV